MFDSANKSFTCASCDAIAHGATPPAGWSHQKHASLGDLYRCGGCTEKVAPKMVTARATAADASDAPSFASNDVITGAAQGRLRSLIERVERLEEDRAVISADLKEVYDEAKGEGFDVKILRKVVRLRKLNPTKRSEEEALISLYLSAAGEV